MTIGMVVSRHYEMILRSFGRYNWVPRYAQYYGLMHPVSLRLRLVRWTFIPRSRQRKKDKKVEPVGRRSLEPTGRMFNVENGSDYQRNQPLNLCLMIEQIHITAYAKILGIACERFPFGAGPEPKQSYASPSALSAPTTIPDFVYFRQ